MGENSTYGVGQPGSPVASKVVGFVQGLLLPVVAVASAFLGLVLLTNPVSGSTPMLDLSLVALGSGTLVFSVVTQPLTAPEAPAVPPTAACPSQQEARSSAAPAYRTPLRGPPPKVPISSRSSEWRVLSAATYPGDETWLSWLPPEHRRLGPAAEGATRGYYSPGRPGSLVALPAREPTPDLKKNGHGPSLAARPSSGAGSTLVPSRSVDSGRRSFTEEELDRMFPPQPGEGSVFLTTPPNRVGTRNPSLPDPSERPGTLSARAFAEDDPSVLGALRPAARSVTDSSDAPSTPVGRDRPLVEMPSPITSPFSASGRDPTDLALEAANPVPPHLRGASAFARGTESRRGNGVMIPKSVCASCSKVVVNLRMSGPCPSCLRPICNDCLRDALVHFGHGWCVDCTPLEEVAAN